MLNLAKVDLRWSLDLTEEICFDYLQEMLQRQMKLFVSGDMPGELIIRNTANMLERLAGT